MKNWVQWDNDQKNWGGGGEEGWGICTILILGKNSYEVGINLCCSMFD